MRESVKKSIKRKRDFNSIHDSNISSKEKKIEDYIDEHGTCNYASVEYSKLLRLEGNNEEALEVLNMCINSKNHLFALSELISIEFNLGKYQDCLKHILELKKYEEVLIDDVLFKEIYCYHILNIDFPYSNNNLRYSHLQILDYDENKALRHIKLHDMDVYSMVNRLSEDDTVNSQENFFSKSINIDETFHNVRKILTNIKIDRYYKPDKEYLFYYPNVGDNTRGRLNYLKVITTLGTNNIITMYPYGEIDKVYILNGDRVYDYEEELEKLREQKVL